MWPSAEGMLAAQPLTPACIPGCPISRWDTSCVIHANRPDMELARWILEQGANVGVDCVGYDERDGCVDYFDRERAELVQTLISWGYLQQVTVSRDMMRQYRLRRHGGEGYAQLLRSFVPTLREAGVTDAQINALLVENPRRILTPAHQL